MSGGHVNVSVSGLIRGFEVILTSDTTGENVSETISHLISNLEQMGAKAVEHVGKENPPSSGTDTSAVRRLASELSLDQETLRSFVDFKDGMVQITKASQLKIADALTMLLYSMEKGYSQPSITVEQFEGLITMNGIKFSYPTTTAIFNMRNSEYLNANLYEKEKKLSLTPKGETNASRAFKQLMEGVIVKRKMRSGNPTRKNNRKRKAKK